MCCAVKELEALHTSITAKDLASAESEGSDATSAGDEEPEPLFTSELLGSIRQTIQLILDLSRDVTRSES